MKIIHLHPLLLSCLETLFKPPTSTQPTNHNTLANNTSKTSIIIASHIRLNNSFRHFIKHLQRRIQILFFHKQIYQSVISLHIRLNPCSFVICEKLESPITLIRLIKIITRKPNPCFEKAWAFDQALRFWQ
jgi:hypothetical protein